MIEGAERLGTKYNGGVLLLSRAIHRHEVSYSQMRKAAWYSHYSNVKKAAWTLTRVIFTFRSVCFDS
jgi:hypothetical protein